MIQGIIGKSSTTEKIIAPLIPVQTVIEKLPQNFNLLFICEKINDAIQRQVVLDDTNRVIEPFEFLDLKINKYLESCCQSGSYAYIETDYFGSVGTQAAGLFESGKLIEVYKGGDSDIDTTMPWPERLLEQPINKVLRKIGVLRNPELDEFDTLGLGEYRHMPYNEI